MLHIWQVNQDDWAGNPTVDLAEGVRLLILRQGVEVAFLPLTAGEHAWLHGVAQGLTLLESQQLAVKLEPHFDLGAALQRQLSQGAFSGWQS